MTPDPPADSNIDDSNTSKQSYWDELPVVVNKTRFGIMTDYEENNYATDTAAINLGHRVEHFPKIEENLAQRARTMASQLTRPSHPPPPPLSIISYAQAARGSAVPAFHPNVQSVNRMLDSTTPYYSLGTQFEAQAAEGSSRDAANTEQPHMSIEDNVATANVIPGFYPKRNRADSPARRKDREIKIKNLKSFHEKFVLLTPTPPDLGPDEIGELAMKVKPIINPSQIIAERERMAELVVGKSPLPFVSSPPVVSSYPKEKEVKAQRRMDAPIVKLPRPDPVVEAPPKSPPPVVSSLRLVQDVSLHALQDETRDLKDAFGTGLAKVSEFTTPAEFVGGQDSLKGSRGQQLRAYNLLPKPSTESILGSSSSVETSTNNLRSRSSAAPQSTVPTSLFDASSSKGPKNTAMQGLSVAETKLLDIAEIPAQEMTQQSDWDDQSSISSVTILDPKQKKDIIKKFVEAVLKTLQYEGLPSHDYTQSRIPFKQRFQVLLKNYSEQVKIDTDQRTRRQAAKQIRLLRREISERFEEAFGGNELSSKDQRVYPNIIKQAEKINPPEKTWAEKVGDWNDVLSNEAPQSETIFENQQYGLQVENQIVALSIGGAGPASHPASLSDFDQTSSSSESEMDEVVHFTPREDKDIYDFLTTHHAFQELIQDVRQLVERYFSDQMEVIRNRVLLGVRRTIDRGIHKPGRQSRHTATFYLDWDILSFLREQYPLGLSQGLESILTISGRATNAYMSTVRNYLEATWPGNPTALLDALQGAVLNYPQSETSGCKYVFSS
jgi:hypothetical protein